MINETSVASAMFEYRFSDSVVLSGHVLGNLMLKALDNLSVRPLDAVNLIRTLLNVDAHLLPMTEFATDLCALDEYGHLIHGEMNIDKLKKCRRR